MDWLLGLSRLSWSDERASFSWRTHLEAWAWLLVILAALAVAVWSYRRLLMPRWAAWVLPAVRAAALVALVALLCGPMLVLRQERMQASWVLCLVDRSKSMQIEDVFEQQPGPEGAPVNLISREEALLRALKQQHEVFGPQGLGKDRQVRWFGFDGASYGIAEPADDPRRWPPAMGKATSIRTAIEQALQSVPGQRILGVVLFSDGASPQSTGPELVRRLQQRGAGVFAVPLGGDIVPVDVSVAHVEAPRTAFVNDDVTVSAWVNLQPQGSGIDPANVVVRLVDPQRPQAPLAERSLAGLEPSAPVRLRARWPTVGPVTWRVEAEYRPAGARVEQANDQRGRRSISIEFVDRPLRVLYVEGAPRWEYRFLKSLLIREKSIRCSIFLISADRSFAQEGDEPITRLPRDDEEMAPYDAIILGDARAQYFSERQIELIRRQVASRATALVWIGGPTHTPASFSATRLADLLPMLSPAQVPDAGADGPWRAAPSAAAEALGLLRFDAADGSDEKNNEAGWPSELPPLQWVQHLGRLKPTAEVLAWATSDGQPRRPLVVTMRYGAGHVLYLASDESWRWRFGRGQHYHGQFWTQLIQMVARGRLDRDTQPVRLSVSHRMAQVHAPVTVEIQIADQTLMSYHLSTIAVEARGDADGASGPERIELTPVAAKVDPVFDEAGPVRYRALWRPSAEGQYMFHVVQPQLADISMSWGPLKVVAPDDELRQRLVDHERLRRLAADTSGRMVDRGDLGALLEAVPRADLLADDLREPLWDSPAALLIVLLVLAVEWSLRKWVRLA
jgi:hypothetical protein